MSPKSIARCGSRHSSTGRARTRRSLWDVGRSAPKFVEAGAVDPNAPGYHMATEWKISDSGSCGSGSSERHGISCEEEVVEFGRIVAELGVGRFDFALRLVVGIDKLPMLAPAGEGEGDAADVAHLVHEAVEGRREVHADVLEDLLDVGLELGVGTEGDGGCRAHLVFSFCLQRCLLSAKMRIVYQIRLARSIRCQCLSSAR